MKKIEDLKQGDILYDRDHLEVRKLQYLCVHPNNKEYHILIDHYQVPIRMHASQLQSTLDKGFESPKDVESLIVEYLEYLIENIVSNW